MFGHYALTLYRSLARHRLYAAINVGGLAVGIAVFLVLALNVRFETSFEQWIPGARKIYAVRETWKYPGHANQASNYTMGGLLEELHADYPDMTGTRVWSRQVTVRQGPRVTPDEVDVVDPNFLQVFDLPLVAGDRRTLLSTPDQLLLSQSRARRYFGAADPIGRRLTISIGGQVHDYKIAGVHKDTPWNTDLNLELIVPLTPQMKSKDLEPSWDHWGSSELATYLRFSNPAAAIALDRALDDFTDRHAQRDMEAGAHKVLQLRTAPLVSLHLIEPKDRTTVTMMGLIGALTLLLAGVNYVNLATARGGLRAREVAVRKVMGATRRSLAIQFLLEALATVAAAALIGLALTELALPLVNAMSGLKLKVQYFGAQSVLPFILVLVVVVGLGVGAYPALVLSRFRPAAVLASARTPGHGRTGSRLRAGLVAAQFTIAITFTIGTGVILAQERYLRDADLGFRRDGVVVVKSFNDPDLSAAQRSSLLSVWRTLAGVVSVTQANIAPGVDDSTSAENIKRPGVAGDGPTVNYVVTGPDFFATYGARMLAGRPLDLAHGLDAPPIPPPGASREDIRTTARRRDRSVVLNRAALATLGFETAQAALGKPLLSGVEGGGFRSNIVVGVVENFRMRSPHAPVPSTYYMLKAGDIDNGVAGVRFGGADPVVVISELQASWRRIAPGVPFQARTVEENLSNYYKPDDQRGRLFTIGAVLAVAIGCVGLYGLAAFTAARRIKEIGIRKTLGASTGDILRLLTGQFLRPVLWANLIAWPLAFVAMRAWLAGFDQRIALGPQYFLGASLLALIVAGATVVGQALRVARAEPARALRHE